MRFLEMHLQPTLPSGVREYDPGDLDGIEEALNRGSLTADQRVGGKDITLRKSGGEYELLVTGPQTAEPGHYRHESLEGALDQVAELVKLAEELEG